MSSGKDGADNSAPNSAGANFSETGTKSETHSQRSDEFQFKADTEMGSIATNAELEHRIENRPKPELEPHLTPDDGTQESVDNAVNDKNELRIQNLRNSLLNAQDKLEKGQYFSQIRGKAKYDFDHTD